MKHWSRNLFLVLVILAIGMIAVTQELPKCPKCQQTTYSSWWKFCPACGAKLPEFQLEGKSAEEEVVLGNVYKNAKWTFRIEKPSDTWTFKTGKDATSFNEDSIVVMTDKSAFAMVIPETMSDMTLKEYEKIVMPKLEDKVVVAHKEITTAGIPGIMDEVEGGFESGQIIWKMTLFKDGDNFYQIHCWTLKQVFNKYRKECDLIARSFKLEK